MSLDDARFIQAVSTVLRHEGGFVNHPNDPGGATKYGVSLRFLRELGDEDGDGWLDGDLDRDGDVDVADIRRMTVAEAQRIYDDQWWERYRYDRLHLIVAAKVFDLAVNMGAGHQELQLAPQKEARKGVFDAAAASEPVQIIFEQAVASSSLPEGLKDAIKLADREVVAALHDYRRAVDMYGPDTDRTTVVLAAVLSALERAQAHLIEVRKEGAVS